MINIDNGYHINVKCDYCEDIIHDFNPKENEITQHNGNVIQLCQDCMIYHHIMDTYNFGFLEGEQL